MSGPAPGGIVSVVKRYIPASYRAMIGPKDKTDYYSLDELQQLADYVQFRFQATVVGATEETSTYNPVMLEFMGKVTTLKFIPAAIDYWLDQLQTETTTGTNETMSFPSRLAHLREIYTELARDVASDYPVLFGANEDMPAVSYGDNGRGVLLTPNPQDWPAPKTSPNRLLLPWEIGDGTGVLPWEW